MEEYIEEGKKELQTFRSRSELRTRWQGMGKGWL